MYYLIVKYVVIAKQSRRGDICEANVGCGSKEKLNTTLISGGDAFRGNTRSHPEHDG